MNMYSRRNYIVIGINGIYTIYSCGMHRENVVGSQKI